MVLAPQTAAMGKIRGPHSRELDISSQSSQPIAFDHAALTVNTDAPNPDITLVRRRRRRRRGGGEDDDIFLLLYFNYYFFYYYFILIYHHNNH